MRHTIAVACAITALTSSTTVLAQDRSAQSAQAAMSHEGMQHNMHHPMHVAGMTVDTRRQVDFPPEMRQNTLANMRDHLDALSEILAALSEADYAKAAKVADARLGMNSPSAEGCKPAKADATEKLSPMASTASMSSQMSMEQMMNQYMPDEMRQMGFAMHQSASDFAGEAAKAAETGNAKPAFAALAKVTQGCSACHSAFRVR